MKVTLLSGGVGSAKLAVGLAAHSDLTVIVNTADDETIRGLHVSPDLDTVLYHLAGLADWNRGWGIEGDTFKTDGRYKELVGSQTGMHEWFALGDLDLATNMFRSEMLASGSSLSVTTSALVSSMGVLAKLLPMSDDRVRTLIELEDGRKVKFQDWFVGMQHAPGVAKISFEGIELASGLTEAVDAIRSADVVVIGPSNPFVSIGPILALTDICEAVKGCRATTVAVSPIIEGRAIKGPADRMLSAFGIEVSPVGIARHYEGLIDALVFDRLDAGHSGDIARMAIKPFTTDTFMRSPEDAVRLAKEIVTFRN